jgi:hypothetical protein
MENKVEEIYKGVGIITEAEKIVREEGVIFFGYTTDLKRE